MDLKLTKNLPCRPGLNLLQYIAGQVESSQPELLSVVEDLEILGEVCIFAFLNFCIFVFLYFCIFVFFDLEILGEVGQVFELRKWRGLKVS